MPDDVANAIERYAAAEDVSVSLFMSALAQAHVALQEQLRPLDDPGERRPE